MVAKIAWAVCLSWCHPGVQGLSASQSTVDASKVCAISFDVTGTLLATKEPVVQSYHDAAVWARLPDPPTPDELKKGFKTAFRERSIESPCFGGVEGISGREWWRATIRRVLYHAKGGRDSYTEDEFQRYFRRVYQHFGSPAGYVVLEDARSLLSSLEAATTSAGGAQRALVLGVTSNTPARHMDSVLPMLDGLHDRFSWFACSQDVGREKPAPEIFADAFRQAKFWLGDERLPKEAVLHVGDSYAGDYCGARAYGFQALLLDRSAHPAVAAYQDWLEAPDYPGKSVEDAERNTITSLEEVASILWLGRSKSGAVQ